MPKVKLEAPVEVPYTDEMLGVPDAMVDEDKFYGIIPNFEAGASLQDGVSGVKSIDTLYENTSQEYIEKPSSGEYAPVQVNRNDYPHREY